MKKRPQMAPIHIGELIWPPLGAILVAAGEKGVVAVSIGQGDPLRFAHELEARRGMQVENGSHWVQTIIERLNGYFEKKDNLSQIPIDYRRLSPFQQAVYEQTRHIPRGSVSTYGHIAGALDTPRSARAVGQALARNPIPIIIPCHRVIGKGGHLRGYSFVGGLQTKQLLLQLEGVMLI